MADQIPEKRLVELTLFLRGAVGDLMVVTVVYPVEQ
jgi:hypothetical protein